MAITRFDINDTVVIMAESGLQFVRIHEIRKCWSGIVYYKFNGSERREDRVFKNKEEAIAYLNERDPVLEEEKTVSDNVPF